MSLIVHPEYEKLKEELSNLILEYETLKHNICPELERKYILNFGLLEYDLYKKDVELSKLKRKLQLIQIQINKGEEVDSDWIEGILKKEFDEYEKNIKKQMEELEDAMNSHVEYLSADETKRLKRIYKQCILRLHPDLNENLSDGEKNLFFEITQAYEVGDLKALEALYYLIPPGGTEPISDMDRLKELIEDIEGKIREIKINYPYNKRDLLASAERMEEYKEELHGLINQFSEEIEKCHEKISRLI